MSEYFEKAKAWFMGLDDSKKVLVVIFGIFILAALVDSLVG